LDAPVKVLRERINKRNKVFLLLAVDVLRLGFLARDSMYAECAICYHATGLHTHIAVVRLPFSQLVFLVIYTG